ncbi:hypothetical protein IMF23_04250 [Chelatococcus daeguensis]|uniref:hypothetical protein n=1 Tax=Chelatococcus daeguensis TaxID=444444 RepID=UPI0007AB7D96|nr:hypothetical protein [Chelatococcus daeguensis]KZE34090.1 hypothetical protein AVW15_17400 [Chelatococcus daeguensis]MBM3082647.1 hypothetical protein [Chelatococcus daeguensis]
MPWAAPGQVSTDPIAGGIEISDADYIVALAGMGNGKVVSVEGGAFALVDPPEPEADPEPSTVDRFRWAIQWHIDTTAQTRNYDSGVTCASYVNSTNPTWAAEATAFTAWRDAVWAYAYAELEKVVNEERPQPTVEDFLAELPPFTWPS